MPATRNAKILKCLRARILKSTNSPSSRAKSRPLLEGTNLRGGIPPGPATKPFKFRNGQRVQAVREPDNEHDANAVAIYTGRPAKKIGYVNKQRAAWVAKILDAGQELEGIIIQSKAASPRVLLTTPEMLAHLQRD